MKWFWDGNLAKIYLWTDRFSSSYGRQFLFQTDSPTVQMDNNFLKQIPQAVRTDDNFFQTHSPSCSNGWHYYFFLERIAQAVQTDDNFFQTDSPSRANGWQIFWNGYPEPFKRIPNPFKNSKTFFKDRVPVITGIQRQFSKNICLEDYSRSRIFRTFVVKFLASLPLLGFSNI